MFNYVIVTAAQYANIPEDVKDVYIVTPISKVEEDSVVNGFFMQNKKDNFSFPFENEGILSVSPKDAATGKWFAWLTKKGWKDAE